MAEVEKSDNLNKIRSAVSEREMEIWRNEAQTACIKRETERLKNEIERLNKSTEEMEREDKLLQEQLEAAVTSIEIQKQTLHACEQILIMQQTLKENLIQEAEEWRIKYAKTLDEYNGEYQDYRAMYERRCRSYKDLRTREVELKKLKITCIDLEVKINNIQQIKKQYETIQEKILHTTVVKFANFYQLYHKNEATKNLFVELKKEEERLQKEHFDLVDKVKKLKENSLVKVENRQKASEKPSVTNEQLPKGEQPAEDKLKKFLSEEILPLSLTSLESTIQRPTFSKDFSKVRVLDIKVKKPQIPKQNVQKSTEALRKKMENIMENTRKNALKSSSQTTPVNSQQSQEDQSKRTSSQTTPSNSQQLQKRQSKPTPNSAGISQTMLNLNLKEKIVNPILKQKHVPPVNPETTSKFFKKKMVTFQTELKERLSQEKAKTDPKIEEKKDDAEKNNQLQDVNKFSLKATKDKIENKFQFSGTENKPVAAFDIFRKPFTLKESPRNHGEKKSFLQNPVFGIFDTNKPNPPSLESDKTANIASGSTSAGTSFGTCRTDNSDKKLEDVDPFETSFNDPLHSPVNAMNKQPATFNFFGSQNISNPFSNNMF